MIDIHNQYPPPASFQRPDGSARFAFMTFVMRNDSFVPGALGFAYALRQLGTQADLVCMLTKNVTPASRSALEQLFDRVVEVDEKGRMVIVMDFCYFPILCPEINPSIPVRRVNDPHLPS